MWAKASVPVLDNCWLYLCRWRDKKITYYPCYDHSFYFLTYRAAFVFFCKRFIDNYFAIYFIGSAIFRWSHVLQCTIRTYKKNPAIQSKKIDFESQPITICRKKYFSGYFS